MSEKMIRTQVHLTKEQVEYLDGLALASGKSKSDYVRLALDRYRASTAYLDEMEEIAAEVHPWMTFEQFQGWLQFQYRLRFEGKKNGNGDSRVIDMLEEILRILKGEHGTEHRG